jgi:Zn-dependent oligopeptidase
MGYWQEEIQDTITFLNAAHSEYQEKHTRAMAQMNAAIESINSAQATISPQIEEIEKRFETLMNVARTLQTQMSNVTERDNESVATRYASLSIYSSGTATKNVCGTTNLYEPNIHRTKHFASSVENEQAAH